MSKFKKAVRGTLNRETGFSLIGMLLALIIIAILYLIAIKVYFKGPVIDEETKEFLTEQGIESDDYRGVVESTRHKMDKVNKEIERREKHLEGLE